MGRISSERPFLIEGMSINNIEEIFERYGLHLEQFPETRMFLEALSGSGQSSKAENQRQSAIETNTAPCTNLMALPDIFKRFYFCEGDFIHGIAWIMVPTEQDAQKLRDELTQSCEGLSVVNPGLAVEELVKEVRSELFMTIGTAALLIIAILVLFFRKGSVLPFVLMPVFMGSLVTAGIMGWAGVNLNPFNFIVLPILIGIGIDDGIHIYRRQQEIRDIRKTLATTGRSVLVTTLTTICGFGSLSMADYHVLRSMGIMAIVGVVACFVFSVITLPAVLQFLPSKE